MWADIACGAREHYPVIPELVLRFVLQHIAGLSRVVDETLVANQVKSAVGPPSPATLARRLAALGTAHRLLGLEDPTRTPHVREAVRAGRRRAVREGTARKAKKRAITRELLEELLATCSREELQGVRDRALLLFGWASGGRRRSEIAGAQVEDLESLGRGREGWLFHLRRSKTDQEGQGHAVPVVGRAAQALAAWLDAAGHTQGSLFRAVDRWGNLGKGISSRAVSEIVKRCARAAGYDPRSIGAHSLRSGFLTEAGRRGMPIRDAMQLSGHRSVTVALDYHQAGAVLTNPAARLAE